MAARVLPNCCWHKPTYAQPSWHCFKLKQRLLKPGALLKPPWALSWNNRIELNLMKIAMKSKKIIVPLILLSIGSGVGWFAGQHAVAQATPAVTAPGPEKDPVPEKPVDAVRAPDGGFDPAFVKVVTAELTTVPDSILISGKLAFDAEHLHLVSSFFLPVSSCFLLNHPLHKEHLACRFVPSLSQRHGQASESASYLTRR